MKRALGLGLLLLVGCGDTSPIEGLVVAKNFYPAHNEQEYRNHPSYETETVTECSGYGTTRRCGPVTHSVSRDHYWYETVYVPERYVLTVRQCKKGECKNRKADVDATTYHNTKIEDQYKEGH